MTSRSFKRTRFCICDSGSYSTQHFLRAISRSIGAHTAAFDVVLEASDAEDDDQLQQQQQQPTQQDDNYTGASTSALNDTQSDDTCEVCSSLHALALHSYLADIRGFVPVVLIPWQQFTSAVPYAVLQYRWFFVYSISRNIASC